MRTFACVVAAAALTLGAPAAALAHQGNPNYRSVVTTVSPATQGLSIAVLNYDDRLQLVNSSRTDVLVLDYQRKPYIRASADGTVAVDLDPLSLLSRLCASVPPPRLHTVRYAGVLASASKLRARLAPKRSSPAAAACVEDTADMPRRSPYRPWAELLKRTFGFDVLACPRCDGRLRLLAMVTETHEVSRYLRALGEPTDVPARSISAAWASRCKCTRLASVRPAKAAGSVPAKGPITPGGPKLTQSTSASIRPSPDPAFSTSRGAPPDFSRASE